jgi:hypothetical protein
MGARLKPFRFVAASGVAGWQLLNFNGLDPDHEPFLGSGDDDAWIGFLNVLHRICRLLVSEGVEAQNLGIGEFDREQWVAGVAAQTALAPASLDTLQTASTNLPVQVSAKPREAAARKTAVDANFLMGSHFSLSRLFQR